jgi:hypothetical protein
MAWIQWLECQFFVIVNPFWRIGVSHIPILFDFRSGTTKSSSHHNILAFGLDYYCHHNDLLICHATCHLPLRKFMFCLFWPIHGMSFQKSFTFHQLTRGHHHPSIYWRSNYFCIIIIIIIIIHLLLPPPATPCNTGSQGLNIPFQVQGLRAHKMLVYRPSLI